MIPVTQEVPMIPVNQQVTVIPQWDPADISQVTQEVPMNPVNQEVPMIPVNQEVPVIPQLELDASQVTQEVPVIPQGVLTDLDLDLDLSHLEAQLISKGGLSDLAQVNQEVQVMSQGELTEELVPDQYMSLLNQFEEMEMEDLGGALDSHDIIGGDKMEALLKEHNLISYIF